MPWKAGVSTVVSGVGAPADLRAGAGVPVRARTGHAAPAGVGVEVNPRWRTVDMYRAVLLGPHLVHPTVLAV